ncbi:MAG: methyltransferase domain-containing protein [Chloroflexota bacterium]
MPDQSEQKKAVSPEKLRAELVDKLCENKTIRSEAVKAAFLAVPRHLFVPETPIEQVYRDQVIPVKFAGNEAISSSSQPAMMAIMLEQLELEPGHKVLEIGAGTGFNAALMAHIVGESGHVTTIDIDQDLVDGAKAHLATADIDNVTVICGNGTHGYAKNGRYDRIILTVGGWDIVPAWWEQLAENGRLLLPLSLNGPQLSIAFQRVGNRLESDSVRPCGFMRLRGEHAEPTAKLSLAENAELHLSRSTVRPEKTAVLDWFKHSKSGATDLTVNNGQMWSAFALWLALQPGNLCSLYAWETAVEDNLYPAIFKYNGEHSWQRSYGLIDENGMALLERPSGHDNASGVTYPLQIRTLGKTAVGQTLLGYLHRWDAAGRPMPRTLKIIAYPAQDAVAESAPSGTIVLRKRWSAFVCQWPTPTE